MSGVSLDQTNEVWLKLVFYPTQLVNLGTEVVSPIVAHADYVSRF